MTNIEFPINMYDPKRDYNNHKHDYNTSIANVLESGMFINGQPVKDLERELEKYTASKHCISVSSGTDALLVGLLASGVKAGDEVITVAHTWISTAEVISLIGAIPVFVDIEDDTFNININLIEDKITDKTKVIMPVNLYGQMPDYAKINAIAEKHNLIVIEDGAQSFGAEQNDVKSCAVTRIGCTSFFPSKPLGCYGDGGACFTNDDALAMKMRAIKNHGGVKRFFHDYIGINGRLDTIQASILLIKLKNFDDCLKKRNIIANYYNDNLKDIGLKLPRTSPNNYHVWAQYSITVDSQEKRDIIVEQLKENNIRVAIFYPKPLHYQNCFSYLGYGMGDLPVTERVCSTIFNLPCYGELSLDEAKYIVDTLKKIILSL